MIIKTLFKAGVTYFVAQGLLRGEKAKQRIRKVANGFLLIMVALLLIYIGIVALVGGLFFFFADMTEFIRPAFFTGLIVIVLAVIALAEGYRSISRN